MVTDRFTYMQKYSNYIHRTNIDVHWIIFENLQDEELPYGKSAQYSYERSANIAFYSLLFASISSFTLSVALCFSWFHIDEFNKVSRWSFSCEKFANSRILDKWWDSLNGGLLLSTIRPITASSIFGLRKNRYFWFALISLNSFNNIKMDIDDETKRFVRMVWP